MKTIIFSAGGTLGHITPAITFIEKIKKTYKDLKIIFIATKKDEAYTVLKSEYIDEIYYLDAFGISKNVFKNIYNVYANLKVIKQIKTIINKNDVVLSVGMGGYISGLCVFASHKLGVKTIIHEQNSIMGTANKFTLKYADRVFTSFKNTHIPKKYESKVTWIGNPRYDIRYKVKEHYFKDKNTILITSGSLGSKVINDVATAFLKDERSQLFSITLVTGKKYYEDVIKNVEKKPHFEILPFSNDLIKELSRSSIVVSRAGASTCFEILGQGIPSILIPSINVANNHQYYNAKSICDESLAYMIEEKDLSVGSLYKAIMDIQEHYDIYINNLKKYNIGCVMDKFISEIDIYVMGE